MKALDKILELLQDSHWHLMDEIKAQFYLLPEDKLKEVIRFLEEQQLIKLDRNKSRAKISSSGLKFLELPPIKNF